MSLPPVKAREAVLLALFALTAHETSLESLSFSGLVLSLMHELKITKARAQEALEKANLVFAEREALKKEILDVCSDYSWNRLGRVEQVILLLLLVELRQKEIPLKVLLAEASRLGKKFASSSSGYFVNAVLDGLHRSDKVDLLFVSNPEEEFLQKALEEGHLLRIDRETSQEEFSLPLQL